MPETACESPSEQARNDLYVKAWRDAPDGFKKRAAAAGIKASVADKHGNAMHYEEGFLTASYTPDMSEALDTHVDLLIERHGCQHATLIRSICEDLKEPLKREAAKEGSRAVINIACLMIKTERAQLTARVHALLHAIPGLAAINGITSMRESARMTGVSPEWVRRSREEWCHQLSIPIPAENSKRPEAVEKMRTNALTNHWRKRNLRALTPIPTKPILCPPNPKSPPSSSNSSSIAMA